MIYNELRERNAPPLSEGGALSYINRNYFSRTTKSSIRFR